MWLQYLGFAGATIAVVNGLIAMAIALLPVRRSVYKLRLGAAAVVLAIVAVGATAYARYHAAAEAAQQLAERGEIGHRLLVFIGEGRELLSQIKDARRELPARPADEWAQRAEIFLREKLGEAYVARYRAEAGNMYGDDLTILPSRLLYWRAVRNRVVNLEMINAEFGASRQADPQQSGQADGGSRTDQSPRAGSSASATP